MSTQRGAPNTPTSQLRSLGATTKPARIAQAPLSSPAQPQLRTLALHGQAIKPAPDRQQKVYPTKRKCKHRKCGVTLSKYNGEDYCYAHIRHREIVGKAKRIHGRLV